MWLQYCVQVYCSHMHTHILFYNIKKCQLKTNVLLRLHVAGHPLSVCVCVSVHACARACVRVCGVCVCVCVCVSVCVSGCLINNLVGVHQSTVCVINTVELVPDIENTL